MVPLALGRTTAVTSFAILLLFSGAGLVQAISPSGARPALRPPEDTEVRLTRTGDAQFAAWSPDSSAILYARPSGKAKISTGWQLLTDLWSIDLDAGTPSKVASNAAYATFSPDGQSIAFLSFVHERTGEVKVWQKGQTKKMGTADWGSPPQWSEDGQRLLFATSGAPSKMTSAGLARTTLVRPKQPAVPGERLLFSPNESYVLRRHYNYLRVLPLDGSPEIEITARPTLFAIWSPDGRKLAYVIDSAELSPELWVVNADGSAKALIAKGELEHFGPPAWSPDGSQLAFGRTPTGNARQRHSRIWLAFADGHGLRPMSNGLQEESEPAWSPDSSYIAFQRRGDIWVRALQR
jgi:Tol biopolymer transport system component